ncbi:MAG: efflux RND transporter permease subunit [Bacteroidales bacterium]|nr:efflux RND transporter permease subunit [Bacteroidales bacterium]
MYRQYIRPYTDPIIGGTLRLFLETNRKYQSADRATKRTLQIRATFPYGTTMLTVNNTIRRMEDALRPYHSLMTLMETNISNARLATITAEFPEKLARGGNLAFIQNEIESRAIMIGNAQWRISGLTDNGFSNELWEQAGDYQIKLSGFDYDRMLVLSDSIRASLLSHNRIKSVEVNSHFDYYKNDNIRYTLRPNPELLSFYGISPYQFSQAIKKILVDDHDMEINSAKSRVVSVETQQFDKWQLLNSELTFGEIHLRLGDIATIEANGRPSTIQRYNQEYTICLQYTYIGTSFLGSQITEEIVEAEKKKLPLGYSLDWRAGHGKWWSEKDVSHWLEAIWVISMLLVISLITLGSVRRSIEVVFSLIPTFIGAFISLAISETPYGQGALAGFVLLAGISVNSALYTLCQEETIKRQREIQFTTVSTWALALSQKMSPILLTSLSTILGFIPMLWSENGNYLWHDMTITLIGGLPASLVGLWLIGLYRKRTA